MQLLYIEDSDFDRLAFKRMMKSLPDISYAFATDLEEATQLLDKQPYSVILRDVILKNHPQNASTCLPDVPTYFTSGSRAILDKLVREGTEPCFS